MAAKKKSAPKVETTAPVVPVVNTDSVESKNEPVKAEAAKEKATKAKSDAATSDAPKSEPAGKSIESAKMESPISTTGDVPVFRTDLGEALPAQKKVGVV